MEQNELVTMEFDGDVARCTLRRPPLNFLNTELLRQFEEHLESLGESPRCRALILGAEGPAFSGGLDVAEQTREGIFLLLEQFHRSAMTLNYFPRPTLALVNGMALGAGNELLACCDFVFANEKATFGQPEIKVGGIPSLAALVLPPLIGQRKTMEMILTGNLIEAQEAERIGLIHRSLPQQQLRGAVDELLNNLRSLSVSVLEVALRTARMARTDELENRLRTCESLYLNQLMELEDSAEGARAFLEKRAPKWQHR
jgi:cyclohexa-1,5-dienecarbonyl-CoA hydratase